MIKYQALLAESALLDNNKVEVDRIETLVQLLQFCNDVSDQCKKNLNSSSLTDGQFVVLMLLKHFGDLKPSELAEKSQLTRSAITLVIDALEERKLVSRTHQREDRRSWTITITEEGVRVFKNVLPIQAEWLSCVFDSLNAREFTTLTKLVAKTTKNFLR